MDLDQEFLKLFEAEVKHECPKCKGEGCDHCDGKGYHVEDEDDDPVGKNEDVELDEMPNRAYKEKINTLLKKHSGKFKWSGEELYVTKEIEKDVKNIISKSKEDVPTIKVSSSPLREAVNLKQLKKQYNKNEDENRHTENYLLLAKAFGSKSEVKKVQDIMKRNEKQGHTSKSDMDWMYKNINPYYDKIRNEETMKLEDTVKQVLETNKNDKSDDGDGLDAVQPKAVKKKFKDRKDKDIDNDGDTDDSDKFLHKKRKAISKAIAKKESVKKETFSKLFSHVKSLMQGK